MTVQALPSLHAEPFGFAGLEQSPVAGLHVPPSWHWSGATQTVVKVGVHTPETHRSPELHALPSLQDAPSDFRGLEHWPVVGLQVPAL